MGYLSVKPNIEMETNQYSTIEALLSIQPQMVQINDMIYLYHPLMDLPDSEFVLMRYSSHNKKKDRVTGDRVGYKKGFCVALGYRPSESERFVFSKTGTPREDLIAFLSGYTVFNTVSNAEQLLFKTKKKRTFGICLRLPNPNYTGRPTTSRNFIVNGQRESFFSAPLRIRVWSPWSYPVEYADNPAFWGVGLC